MEIKTQSSQIMNCMQSELLSIKIEKNKKYEAVFGSTIAFQPYIHYPLAEFSVRRNNENIVCCERVTPKIACMRCTIIRKHNQYNVYVYTDVCMYNMQQRAAVYGAFM